MNFLLWGVAEVYRAGLKIGHRATLPPFTSGEYESNRPNELLRFQAVLLAPGI
jgi:hypothetical protein